MAPLFIEQQMIPNLLSYKAPTSYELQKVDCNCNDCKFMVRDLDKYQKSIEFHRDLQQKEFDHQYERLKKIALEYRRQNELEKYQQLSDEVRKMKFQFDKSGVTTNYGNCSKFSKPVSFIPGHIQLETQECFVHRKD